MNPVAATSPIRPSMSTEVSTTMGAPSCLAGSSAAWAGVAERCMTSAKASRRRVPVRMPT